MAIVTSVQPLGVGYAIGLGGGEEQDIRSYAENPDPDQPWPPELGSDWEHVDPVEPAAPTAPEEDLELLEQLTNPESNYTSEDDNA